jgi:hypothetical protein
MRTPLRPSGSLVLPALLGLGTLACAPVQVDFVCEEDEPLCDLVEIMNDDRPEATGIDLSAVYLYQASEVPLMEGLVSAGAPDIPIVAGRYALFRALVEPHEDFVPRELTGRLYLYRDNKAVAAYQVDSHINGPSSEGSLGSSFDFLVPGEVIVPDISWSVSVVETTGGGGGDEAEGYASWPGEPGQPLTVTEGADLLRIMIVPVAYEADGSGRLPDISDSAIELYRSYMYSNYPAADVEMTVSDEFPWSGQISSSTAGWSELLSAVGNARASLGAEDDQYLYGMFQPAADFNTFCAGGCVTGLSNMPGASDVYGRASIGVGYGGGTSAETMVHEVGHAHGRNHVDGGCGSGGGDSEYPHEGGLIGVRGYDWRPGSLVDPASTWDFMTYCSSVFVSDHNFDKLHGRITSVRAAYHGLGGPPVSYWALYVMPDGAMAWGRDRQLRQPPGAFDEPVELLDGHGRVIDTVQAHFTPYSEGGGGSLSFPAPARAVVAVRYQGRVSPIR